MEGAEACRAQASGMAAMSSVLLCQLSMGDHMVIARAAFGPTRWVTDNLLPRFGIACTAVDGRDVDAWADAIRPNTKVFFFETPGQSDHGHCRHPRRVRSCPSPWHYRRGR